MNKYKKYRNEIAAICKTVNYDNCEECPLLEACNLTKHDGETTEEFTERWETAVASYYEQLKKLWYAACSGDIESLKVYFENNGKRNRRYFAFWKFHSLIAGAYRNGKMETVKYLYSVGETPAEHEKEEIKFSPYKIIIEKKNGTVESIGFNSKENAYQICHSMEKIAVEAIEDILRITIEEYGKPLAAVEF